MKNHHRCHPEPCIKYRASSVKELFSKIFVTTRSDLSFRMTVMKKTTWEGNVIKLRKEPSGIEKE